MSNQSGLDAAVRAWGLEPLIVINLVCCSLSLFGSLVMIVPFFVSKQLRKVRHRMILGLAVNDLVQAVTVLVPSIYVSIGPYKKLQTDSPGCIADSFFYLALVVAGCFWALAIAISTYVTLVQPMSRMACWLQYTWAMPAIWAGIWLVSFVNAAIGSAVFPSIDAGGFCFFQSVSPNIYGSLVIFIPRTFVFIIIIALYVRLFLFFRRQSVRAQRTESQCESADMAVPLPTPVSLQVLTPGISNDIKQLPQGVDDSSPETTPVYEIQNFHAHFAQYQMGGVGLRKGSKDSQTTLVTRPLAHKTSSQPIVPILEGEETTIPVLDSDAILHGEAGFAHQLAMLESLPSTYTSPRIPQAGSHTPPSPDVTRLEAEDVTTFPGLPDTAAYRFPAAATHMDAPTTPLISPCTETFPSPAPAPGSSSPAIAPMPMRTFSQNSALSLKSLKRREYEKVNTSQMTSPTMESPALGLARAETGEMGFWEALSAVAPTQDNNGQLGGQRGMGRRMSASEENRRVSYLMIAYPMAYAIIVAVSVARTLSSLVTGFPPNPTLQILNRIFVLSIGFIDAMIYTIIEWRFRAATRAASR